MARVTKAMIKRVAAYAGSRRSKKKAESARVNGLKGGRPKGSKNKYKRLTKAKILIIKKMLEGNLIA